MGTLLSRCRLNFSFNEITESANLLEEIEIGPVERYKRYKVLPLRLFAHVVVVVLLLVHVLEITEMSIQQDQSYRRNWQSLLLQTLQDRELSAHSNGYDYNSEDYYWFSYLEFNSTKCAHHVVSLVDMYFKIPQLWVDTVHTSVSRNQKGVDDNPSYTAKLHQKDRVPRPKLEYELMDINDAEVRHHGVLRLDNSHQVQDLLLSNKTALEITTFFRHLSKLRIVFWVESLNPKHFLFTSNLCTLWQYRYKFKHLSGGAIGVTLEQGQSRQCPTHRVNNSELAQHARIRRELLFRDHMGDATEPIETVEHREKPPQFHSFTKNDNVEHHKKPTQFHSFTKNDNVEHHEKPTQFHSFTKNENSYNEEPATQSVSGKNSYSESLRTEYMYRAQEQDLNRHVHSRQSFLNPDETTSQLPKQTRSLRNEQHHTGPRLLYQLEGVLAVGCVVHFIANLFRLVKGVLVLRTLQRTYAQIESEESNHPEDVERRISFNSIRRRGSLGSILSTGAWNGVPFDDKLKIVNLWVILATFGDLMVLFYCVVDMRLISDPKNDYDLFEDESAPWAKASSALLGIGALLLCTSILEYVEYTLVNYLFIQVNRVASRDIVQQIIVVLPLFAGYSILGVILYANHSARFADFTSAALCLFAVLLGDEMRDTFMDLLDADDIPAWITGLYITSFVLVFAYVVSMIFISIVEEACITQGLWLLDDQQDGTEPAQRRVEFSGQDTGHGYGSGFGNHAEQSSSLNRRCSPHSAQSSPRGGSRAQRHRRRMDSPGQGSRVDSPGRRSMMGSPLHRMDSPRNGTPVSETAQRSYVRQQSGVSLAVSERTARILSNTTWAGVSSSSLRSQEPKDGTPK